MIRPVILGLLVMVLAGCEKAMHDMYDQPKYKPLAPSTLFADGSSARTPPAGSIAYARGNLAGTSSGRNGERAVIEDARAMAARTIPYPLTLALLERGRQRYAIYCAPCHSPLGDGDGLVVRHGFPAPPSYHSQRLRNAPDRHLFDVITDGYGIMYSYADRVTPGERWAIVAYIRALQRSQQVDAGLLSPSERAQLDAARPMQ
jgi:mono/diheme cytochrome c family protein